jgi:hypothetical protein
VVRSIYIVVRPKNDKRTDHYDPDVSHHFSEMIQPIKGFYIHEPNFVFVE